MSLGYFFGQFHATKLYWDMHDINLLKTQHFYCFFFLHKLVSSRFPLRSPTYKFGWKNISSLSTNLTVIRSRYGYPVVIQFSWAKLRVNGTALIFKMEDLSTCALVRRLNQDLVSLLITTVFFISWPNQRISRLFLKTMFIILALNSECWSSLGSFLKIPLFRCHKESSEQNKVRWRWFERPSAW